MQKYSGFTVEQTEDGVYIWHISGSHRKAVDEWVVVDHQQSVDAHESTGHCMRLYYIDNLIFPTPYLYTHINENVARTPEGLFESSAFIVPNQVAYSIFSVALVRRAAKRQRTAFKIFLNEAEAVNWLKARDMEIRGSDAQDEDHMPRE